MVKVGALIVTKEELVQLAYQKKLELTVIEYFGELAIEVKSESIELKERLGSRPSLERILSEIFDLRIIKLDLIEKIEHQITFAKGDLIMYYVL